MKPNSLKTRANKLKELIGLQSILKHKVYIKYSQKTNINELDKLWAYVVFESPRGKTKIIQKFASVNQMKLWKYSKDKKWRFWVKPKKNYKLLEKYKLSLRTAPDPTEIIWENLEISNKETYWRGFVVVFIIVILLLIGCFIIYFARIYRSSLDNAQSCQSVYDKPVNELQGDTEINCFWSHKTFSMVLTDRTFRDIWWKYIYIVIYKQLIILLISAAVFAFNEGIELILTKLK